MKPFTPSVQHAWIVRHLLAQKSIREISRLLGKSPKTILFAIRRLEKHGYLVRQVRSDHSFYSLTLEGYSLLEMLKGNTQEKTITESVIRETPTEKPQQFWRLHALQFKIPLKDPIPSESIHLVQFKDHPTRLRNLQNHSDLIVDFQDFTCTLSTRALKITGIQIRLPYEAVEDPEILLEKATQTFMPEIENLESIFRKHFPKLKLRRLANNTIDVKVIKGELALEADTLAVKVGDIQKKTGEKLKVYDPEDNKLSMIVDFSKGPPELEGVHPKRFIENMQIYKGFLEDLTSGKFYKRFEAIQEVQEEQQQILKKTQELHKELTTRTDESLGQVIDLIQKMSVQFYSSLEEMRKVVVELKR